MIVCEVGVRTGVFHSESASSHPRRNVAPPPLSDAPVLQRLGEVRRQQGISQHNVARHLKINLAEVRRQEEPTADLPLSMLLQWRKLLDVPMASLLVESDEFLSSPVQQRARLVRVMKTAAAILERSESSRMRRLAQTLVEQLVELMPELKDVEAWHAVGRRRNDDDYGRILERTVSDDIFNRRDTIADARI